jgi:putative hemolysin
VAAGGSSNANGNDDRARPIVTAGSPSLPGVSVPASATAHCIAKGGASKRTTRPAKGASFSRAHASRPSMRLRTATDA